MVDCMLFVVGVVAWALSFVALRWLTREPKLDVAAPSNKGKATIESVPLPIVSSTPDAGAEADDAERWLATISEGGEPWEGLSKVLWARRL